MTRSASTSRNRKTVPTPDSVWSDGVSWAAERCRSGRGDGDWKRGLTIWTRVDGVEWGGGWMEWGGWMDGGDGGIVMNMNRRLLPHDNRCVCSSSFSLIFLHILSPSLSLSPLSISLIFIQFFIEVHLIKCGSYL